MGNLASDERAIAKIEVEPVEAGILNNYAKLSYEDADPATAATADSESTTVVRVADLSLTMDDLPTLAVAGSELALTLIATNNGPSNATNVTLINILPPGVAFISADSALPDCEDNGGIVECILGDLTAGASVKLTIPVAVDPSVTGSMTNTAYLVTREADLDVNNNTVRETISIKRAADLSLSKTYSPSLAREDNRIAYTFDIINNGPSGANGVTLTDNVPEGLTFDSFTGGARDCNAIEDTVTCRIGNLAPEDRATVTIVYAYTTERIITTTARVTAEEADPIPSNDGATEAAEVRFVLVETTVPQATTIPEQIDPTPVATAEPAEEAPPATPESRGNMLGWIFLLIAIGGVIFLVGGLWIIFWRRRHRDRDDRRNR